MAEISADRLWFGTYADSEETLAETAVFIESLRAFGGRYASSPVMVYVRDDAVRHESGKLEAFAQDRLAVQTAEDSPPETRDYYYHRKVFAAAEAEQAIEGRTDVLVWVDVDTVVLKEPVELALKDGLSFGFCPVMHNRTGSAINQPPNEFWSRIYEVLGVGEEQLFPIVTPADEVTIRAYFNAGLMAVRPSAKILRRWSEDFVKIAADPVLARMCQGDETKRIFLHQTALVGAVLNSLERNELVELPGRYNYPLFFETMFGANRPFVSLFEAVTIRYDCYFRNPEPDWADKLEGPPELIEWLRHRLPPR